LASLCAILGLCVVAFLFSFLFFGAIFNLWIIIIIYKY
jgi:hypothetical protein